MKGVGEFTAAVAREPIIVVEARADLFHRAAYGLLQFCQGEVDRRYSRIIAWILGLRGRVDPEAWCRRGCLAAIDRRRWAIQDRSQDELRHRELSRSGVERFERGGEEL
jgi:hypothetical protein